MRHMVLVVLVVLVVGVVAACGDDAVSATLACETITPEALADLDRVGTADDLREARDALPTQLRASLDTLVQVAGELETLDPADPDSGSVVAARLQAPAVLSARDQLLTWFELECATSST